MVLSLPFEILKYKVRKGDDKTCTNITTNRGMLTHMSQVPVFVLASNIHLGFLL